MNLSAAQGAAERADLNRRVFQRLNLGLLTLAGSAAALEALYAPIFTPGGLAAGAAASLPALLVSGYHYHRTSGHGANPLPVLAVRSTVDMHALQRSSAELQWQSSLMAGAAASLPALLVSGYHYHRTSGHGANPLPVLAVRPQQTCTLCSCSCISRMAWCCWCSATTTTARPGTAPTRCPCWRCAP